MKINLCCGMDYREGYINVDFADVGSDGKPIKIDLKHDILYGLPWQDDSVDELVFRESLEHFNRVQGYQVLKEITRVLKPGGKLDLSVPNAPKQLKMLLAYSGQAVTIKQWLDPHSSPWSYAKYHEDVMGATHFDSKGDSHLTLYTRKLLHSITMSLGLLLVEYKEDSSFYLTLTK